METRHILGITGVLVVVFFIMLSMMYKAEQGRPTQAELNRQIRWEQSCQTMEWKQQ